MAVVVVGAGRVGIALALRLLQSGRDVTGIVARSTASKRRVAAVLPTVPVVQLDGREVAQADTVLLCVADDDLAPTVRSLTEQALSGPTQLVAHTSGRHGLSVLAGLRGPTAAIHPAMTFAGGPDDSLHLPGVVYAVTADAAAMPLAAALVADLEGVVAVVDDGARPLYHAAMSHAANHLVILIADAAELLRRAGVDDPAAALAPITRAALANVLASGDAALTGPISRGDTGTVAAHLEALEGDPVEASYVAMATRTVQRALGSGRLQADQGAALLDRLSGAR